MTLLSVVKDVCAVVGVAPLPQSVFTNLTGNRTMTEMLSLANEMAQRIAYDTREWGALVKLQTMTGDGVKTGFPMPSDFQRFLLTANVWRSTNKLSPMTFIPDPDEWVNRRSRGIYGAYGEWTTFGSQLMVAPTMGIGVTATFVYLHKNCVTLASSGAGDSFIADGDSFLLGDRLLKLGMIWQWKANKGSPYNEDMATYSDAIAMAMGHDTPAPIIIGRAPASTSLKTAYPWPVPT